MSLLTALILKNNQKQSYFDWNLLYLFKKGPRPNVRGF